MEESSWGATPGSAVTAGNGRRRQPALGHKSFMERPTRQAETTATRGHSRGSREGVGQEEGRSGNVRQLKGEPACKEGAQREGGVRRANHNMLIRQCCVCVYRGNAR